MKCAKCGYANKDGALTCNLCGELLRGGAKPSAPPVPPPPDIPPAAKTDPGGPLAPSTAGRTTARPVPPATDAELDYCLVCFPLDPVKLSKNKPLTIGRSKGNDLILPVGMVSREHARVWWNGETFEIRDLGSSNGTFVNEAKVERRALANGDQIKIGPYELSFRAVTADAGKPAGGEETMLEVTQNISKRDLFEASSTFSGNIGEMKLDEVFQLIDFNRKTGSLDVESGDRKGTFHFLDGQILHGEFHGTKGMVAVARALALPAGKFSFRAGTPACERTIFEPTGKVMLDAMRRLDEFER